MIWDDFQRNLNVSECKRVVFSPPVSSNMAGKSPSYTLWLFNIAMENGPFIEDFPIKTSIYKGFSMAMLNNQMVDFL